MKSRLAVAALFLATLFLALWWFDVFSPPSNRPTEPPPPALPPSATPGLSVPEVKEPKDEPSPEDPRIDAPIRALILGEENRSFTAWVILLLDLGRSVTFQAWYAVPPGPGVQTHSESLPELTSAPSIQDLDAAQVLVVAAFEPSRLPAEFWSHVADRVRAGSLGVLLLPDYAKGQAMAEIDALKPLTPVAKARAVAGIVPGGPVAGVFASERPFLLADDAVDHPAARIVDWKGWNQKWWTSLGEGGADASWSTKFCSPVETLAPGARVIARVQGGAEAVPALVAAPGDVRVLWAGGFFDLGKKAYLDAKRSEAAFRALLHNWMAWLASPRP